MYKTARANPERFFIGIDSNAENLAAISRKAGRKPAKGGSENALFVWASAEALPDELDGLVTDLSVFFPWGALLKAVAQPDFAVLQGFRRLCQPKATLKIVFGYNRQSEPGITNNLNLPRLTYDHLQHEIVPVFRQAGFAINGRPISRAEIKALPTSWAKRLAFGKARPYFHITGQAI